MLHAGLDLSRRRLDFCLLDEGRRARRGGRGRAGRAMAWTASCAGSRGDSGRVEVRAAIESMTGARFVHDTLERCGWEVEIADAVKVKGLAPLACKTDRIDAWVLAELCRRDLVPAIWLPDFRGAPGARARALAAASGQAPFCAQAARARTADDIRACLPGQRPVRR